ncbi:hypothetical protein [Chromobacterium phragmitis]|uniref:Uncharacterized protein n=1 Tax=Chromobacterium phragmitis TaxID=2202141 RepID=A0A344UHR2_9NEIS|nr:hypothetical protein [Chromobacterium phragmitis]AXE34810.1 hypothetical protein DK843_11215 [Chromobacterium phragmitis]
MKHYQDKQEHAIGHFKLEIWPYLAPPDNRFEDMAALQYGADFRLSFMRQGIHADDIGLLQLIWPQTRIFPHTVVQAWNIDKRAPEDGRYLAAACLYGGDYRIGEHSAPLRDQPTRKLSPTECLLLDTPRELSNQFSKGAFTGSSRTAFANYVLNLSTGLIFPSGLSWEYQVRQEQGDFAMDVTPPTVVDLKKQDLHQQAIANFLGLDRSLAKTLIQR